MESSDKPAVFRVLGVRSVSSEALRRPFFRYLWSQLGVEPVSGLTWADDDVLVIGEGLSSMSIDAVPMAPARGYIDLWVDNLEAAVKSLSARRIHTGEGSPSAGRAYPGFHVYLDNGAGHSVKVRLTQAPPELMAAIVP